jgi:hypothetical protein
MVDNHSTYRPIEQVEFLLERGLALRVARDLEAPTEQEESRFLLVQTALEEIGDD